MKRYIIRLPGVLRELTSSLCSSIGSLTNASKVARTVNSKKGLKTNSETISTYLSYLTDSFLFSKAERYNIKNKRYFEYPSKFYCTDIGLRNVRLGLRQQEQTELRPFDAIDDSFTKIVISKSYGKRWFNKKGILRLGILDFLLDTFLLDNQR